MKFNIQEIDESWKPYKYSNISKEKKNQMIKLKKNVTEVQKDLNF